MTTTPYTGAAALAREADKIALAAPYTAPALPPLIVLTDPERLPDPVHLATHLPAPCALIYRHFGAPDARQISLEAGVMCKKRGITFLLSCDSGVPPGTDMGVHFPEHMHEAIADWRKSYPHHVFTAAAHSAKAARHALALGADTVLLSPVFDSVCTGSNVAMGVAGFTQKLGAINGPVYALGGITVKNAMHLSGHASGLATVSGVFG